MLNETPTILMTVCTMMVLGCHNRPEPRVVPPAPDFVASAEPTVVVTEIPASDGERRLLPVDTVYFELDSADLTPAGEEILSAVADWTESMPEAEVVIEGYADRTGPANYNLLLSQRRAETVARFLAQRGVPTARMEIYAMGERGASASNHAADRRVRVYAHAPSPPVAYRTSSSHTVS